MIRNLLQRAFRRLVLEACSITATVRPTDPSGQVALQMVYRQMLSSGKPLPPFSECGFKVFSQTDEDGLLLLLFAVLGTTDRRCVEICAGDGIECNSANLILNHGWNGTLVDGSPVNVAMGQRFYRQHRLTYTNPPRFLCEWVTRGGLNGALEKAGVSGDLDLLSLDLDGVDYWIWEALEIIRPRVVVLEYQDILGPDRSLTVPYADDFDCRKYPMTDGGPNFAGASLSAFVKLGRRKGYRLVGVNRLGFNAFFVRADLAPEALPEVPVHACFGHEKVQRGMRERWPTVARLPWVEV